MNPKRSLKQPSVITSLDRVRRNKRLPRIAGHPPTTRKLNKRKATLIKPPAHPAHTDAGKAGYIVNRKQARAIVHAPVRE
jgi:hypothetical protein